MEEPAAYNIRASIPEGHSQIIHMGREMSNLQGIFGGFKLPKMLCFEDGVISFGPEVRTGWDDYSLLYVLVPLHSYQPVTPLSFPIWIMQCSLPFLRIHFIEEMKVNSRVSSVDEYYPYTVSVIPCTHTRWWSHLRTFKTMSSIWREIAPLLAYWGEGWEDGGGSRNLISF